MLFHKQSGNYLDATNYNYLSFWVKGKTGEENFAIGVADKQSQLRDNSIKSRPITNYLGRKRLGDKWSKVEIPLSEFKLNKGELASISFAFESKCFPNGAGKGSIYIDDLGFE